MNSSAIIWGLVGGALAGIAASLLLLFNGRVLGVSGILAGTLEPLRSVEPWRFAFLAGLVAGGLVLHLVGPPEMFQQIDRSPAALAVSGILVGFGTSLSSGCTSGHGVCGISRRSPRSIWATATFIGAGALSVFVVNHLLGGRL